MDIVGLVADHQSRDSQILDLAPIPDRHIARNPSQTLSPFAPVFLKELIAKSGCRVGRLFAKSLEVGGIFQQPASFVGLEPLQIAGNRWKQPQAFRQRLGEPGWPDQYQTPNAVWIS